MVTRPIRILSLPVDDGGCGNYRVKQPFEMINRFTDSDAHVISTDKDDMVEVMRAFAAADIIMCRPGSPVASTKAHMEETLAKASNEFGLDLKLTAKWVTDIDDNVEIISPYSIHYAEYGISEFFDNNTGQWMWKDGERGFDVQRNVEKMVDHIQDLRDSDAVITSTPKLAEYASQYNDNVMINPNTINFERWWGLRNKPNRQMRVGWSGGLSHYEDWHSIKGPLNKLLRKYKFKLIMAGSNFPGIIDEDLRYLIEVHDWVPFKGHSYRMMCMNLDFAIIPLSNLPFNHYKSNVKWYEFAAMECPCVVANVEPYNTEIVDGKTGLLYDSSEMFEKAVESLLNGSFLKRHIAKNANKWVKSHRNSEMQAELFVRQLKSLVNI
jgi:glycosyltransferase involved in cell wall biosynthesis